MHKLFFLILFYISIALHAQNGLQWSFHGYVRSMQTISFMHPDSTWMTENLIHNRLNFHASWRDSLRFEAGVRNRLFYGETVTSFPGYAALLDRDSGLVDWSFKLLSGKSFFLLSQIDRAYFDYRYKKWDFTIGRQRINWAQTFVWNPNDIFNTYSFFDFDYDEKPGSDAMRIQYSTGVIGRIDVAAKADSAGHVTAAALWLFNKKGFDIQLLGGLYRSRDIAAGVGFSGNAFKGTLRSEMTWFKPLDDFTDSMGVSVVSLGYDYIFKNGIMVQTEALYNPDGISSGRFSINDFYNLNVSPKNLSVSKWSLFGMMNYQINPIINSSFSYMYYPGIQSMFAGPSLTFSVSQNMNLLLLAYHFREFSPANGHNRFTMVFWRLDWNF